MKTSGNIKKMRNRFTRLRVVNMLIEEGLELNECVDFLSHWKPTQVGYYYNLIKELSFLEED